MNDKEMIKVENYFEAFLIITLISFFLYLIKSFLIPVLFASTLVFLTYNFYQKILNKVKSENFAAFFVLFIVLSMIVLPIYVISVELVNQTTIIADNSNSFFSKMDLSFCQNFEFCSNLENNLKTLDFSFNSLIIKIGNYFTKSFSIFIDSISKILIYLFIFILAFFFLLKDGEKFSRYVKRIIPMKTEYKNALFLKFRDVSSAVFINVILIAAIQGILVGIGFWLFGLPSPLFWGIIATFFSLLPMVGAAFVWLPAAIYLFFTHSYIIGIVFALYGAFIVSLSDNLLRPILLKKKIEVHPFLILLSILGAMELFGFMGIFLGPIFISLLVSILQLYNLDFK